VTATYEHYDLAMTADAERPEVSRMQRDWNERALSNALYAIDASRRKWDVDAFYSRGPELVEEIVDPVLERLEINPTGRTVLEIGCGIGRLFAALSTRFGSIIGIDVSDRMINMGQEFCPVSAKWMIGDGISLTGIENDSVDHVLSYEVFQHIPDPQVIASYVREIHRVLQPGGTFQVQLRMGSDTRRQELIRHLPRMGRIFAGRALHLVGILPVRGDVDTWLGVVIAPAEVLRLSSSVGFADLEILPDHIHSPGMGYWIIGRKSE
jgi:SAM-dependent methyltransferase